MEDVVRAVQSRITPYDLAELTYRLVRIPSETGHEGEAARFYAGYLNDAGVPAILQAVAPERFNVIGQLPGVGGGTSPLFFGHIDTIPWGVCVPARLDKDVVWGRGACDMKGSLAAIAVAAKAVAAERVNLRGTIWIGAGAGHEVPWPVEGATAGLGDGVRLLARSIRDGDIKPDCCIVAEGALDRVKVAQGGQAVFRVRVSGGPGAVHALSTGIDHCPAVWGSEVVVDLRDYSKEIEARQPHPLIPQQPRLELGTIHSGDFFNRNPAEATIVGSLRWNPDWSKEQVEQDFRQHIEATRQRLIAKYGDDSLDIDLAFWVVRDACDQSQNPETLGLAELVANAARPIVGEMKPVFGTRISDDMAIFYKEAGLPTVCHGPNLPEMAGVAPSGEKIGGAHSDNEGILSHDLWKLAQIYAALMIDLGELAD